MDKGIITDIEKMVGGDERYSFGLQSEPKTNEAPPGEVPKTPVDNPPVGEASPPAEPPQNPPESKKEDAPSPEELTKQLLSGVNERLGTQYNDFEALRNDYASLATLRESEAKLKDYVKNVSNPFGEDTELAGIYGFKKETGRSIDDYYIVNGLDLNNADSMDIMVADAILNNPALRGKESVVRRAIEKKYNLVGDELDDDEKETNRVTLDIDSSKARQFIADLKEKIKSPEFENPYKEPDPSIWEGHSKQWDSLIPGIARDLEKFDIYESAGDQDAGKDPLTSIEIPKEVIAEYGQKLKSYIGQSRLEPTEDNQNALYGLMLQDYIINNYLNIANRYAAKKLEDNNAMWKERTGLDISKLGQDKVAGAKGSETEKFNKEQLDKVLKDIGVRH